MSQAAIRMSGTNSGESLEPLLFVHPKDLDIRLSGPLWKAMTYLSSCLMEVESRCVTQFYITLLMTSITVQCLKTVVLVSCSFK